MKIAIRADNAAKIEAALKAVNRDAVAHTFTTFDQIAREADNAEAALLKLINKGDAKGAHGDLFATVRVVLPDKTSDELKELAKKLRDASPYDPRKDLG